MKHYRELSSSIGVSRGFVILLLLTAMLLIAVAVASYVLDIPVSKFTRDPLAITNGHPLYGFLSNIGAILWSSSMALCFFSFIILKRNEAPSDLLYFIVSGGVLGLMLLLDDLFMLHERIYPAFFRVSENLVLLTYVLLLAFYFVVFFKRIINTNFIYLACFIFFFTFSLLVDSLPESLLPMHHIFEDGSKLLGISSWLGYHISVCYHAMQLQPTPAPTS